MVNQCGFAGAVRAQEPDCAPTQFPAQRLKDWSPAKGNAQVIEIYDWREICRISKAYTLLNRCSYRHAFDFISLS